jgi:hypothetical protein
MTEISCVSRAKTAVLRVENFLLLSELIFCEMNSEWILVVYFLKIEDYFEVWQFENVKLYDLGSQVVVKLDNLESSKTI